MFSYAGEMLKYFGLVAKLLGVFVAMLLFAFGLSILVGRALRALGTKDPFADDEQDGPRRVVTREHPLDGGRNTGVDLAPENSEPWLVVESIEDEPTAYWPRQRTYAQRRAHRRYHEGALLHISALPPADRRILEEVIRGD